AGRLHAPEGGRGAGGLQAPEQDPPGAPEGKGGQRVLRQQLRRAALRHGGEVEVDDAPGSWSPPRRTGVDDLAPVRREGPPERGLNIPIDEDVAPVSGVDGEEVGPFE